MLVCWYAAMLVWKGLENETTEASNGDKTHCVRLNHVTVVYVGAFFPDLMDLLDLLPFSRACGAKSETTHGRTEWLRALFPFLTLALSNFHNDERGARGTMDTLRRPAVLTTIIMSMSSRSTSGTSISTLVSEEQEVSLLADNNAPRNST